jgi:hypothetical protein
MREGRREEGGVGEEEKKVGRPGRTKKGEGEEFFVFVFLSW